MGGVLVGLCFALLLVGSQAEELSPGDNRHVDMDPAVSRAIRPSAFFQEFADAPRATHENLVVHVEGKILTLLGRQSGSTDGNPTIAIFNMMTNSWQEFPAFDFGGRVPVHHCQGVEWRGSAIIGGCLKGDFPTEEPLADIYRYFPNTNVWENIGRFPSARSRGATALVIRRGQFYFINGGRGHKQGPETTTNMFDRFNPRTGAWTTLPDTPRVRDHGGAIYHQKTDEIFVGGGRWGGQRRFPLEQFAYKQIDVYAFSSRTWSTLDEQLQVGHPGNTPAKSTKFFVICGGEILSDTTAPALCEFLDMNNKVFVRKTLGLRGTERHGTGLVACRSNQNILCTTNGARREPGANIDLFQTECLFTNGVRATCRPNARYWS